jgi:prepilin-type N-terminal cleavage/methylation domain-containing protein
MRQERGFTLVEMLLALTVGMVLIIAAYGLMDASGVQAVRVTDRVDTTQRARLAMDEITRQLRSQVCLAAGTASITDGRDNSITFYSYTGSGAYVPVRHTITYDPQSHTIVESDYSGTGAPPGTTYPAQPTATRTLLTDAWSVGTSPVFAYYAWSSTGTVAPSVQLPTPLTAADALRTVRVTVQFTAQPKDKPTSVESTTLQDEVFSRTADPNGQSGPGLPPCE